VPSGRRRVRTLLGSARRIGGCVVGSTMSCRFPRVACFCGVRAESGAGGHHLCARPSRTASMIFAGACVGGTSSGRPKPVCSPRMMFTGAPSQAIFNARVCGGSRRRTSASKTGGRSWRAPWLLTTHGARVSPSITRRRSGTQPPCHSPSADGDAPAEERFDRQRPDLDYGELEALSRDVCPELDVDVHLLASVEDE
jgi:hypothetical protein